MELHYLLLLSFVCGLVSGVFITLLGVILGGRMVFRAAGGEGGVLVNQSHPEIVTGDDEEDEEEPEIENEEY